MEKRDMANQKVKNITEFKEKYAAIYLSILRVFQELHYGKHNFFGLKRSLRAMNKKHKRISDADFKLFKSNIDLNVCLNNFILKSIAKYEQSHGNEVELDTETRKLFEKEIYQYAVDLLHDYHNGGKTIFEPDQKDAQENFDINKFKLSGANILKYRFYCSCGNAAKGFIEMYNRLLANGEIQPLTIKVLTSTMWNKLYPEHSGTGHTIPCVEIDGNLYAFDPQVFDNPNSVDMIFEDIKVGNAIHHLIRGWEKVPYRVMNIVDVDEFIEKYSNHDVFVKDSTLTNIQDIKDFLNKEDVRAELKNDNTEQYINFVKIKILKKANKSLQNQTKSNQNVQMVQTSYEI